MVLPFVRAAQAQFGLEHARQTRLPDIPLSYFLLDIINYALLLAAVIALGFLVYGGFKYITAEGDDAKIQEAKKTITGAVIGLAVIGIAAAIVNFVIEALGGG